MKQGLIATLAAAVLALAVPAAAQDTFRAPRMAAIEAVVLEAPAEKSAAPRIEASGRLRVADVRALPKAAPVTQWTPIAGGFVARLSATSAAAEGLRVKLVLAGMPGAMEVRVQGSGSQRVETMTLDPWLAAEAWTPWTEGPSQLIELFSPVAPAAHAVSIGALLHFTDSPVAKAAASCTIPTACTSGESALDAMIAERKKSVIKLQYVNGGGGFLCSATLIDTPRRPSAFVLTANHCIDAVAAANSITAFWFYESTSCADATPAPGRIQVPGGMQLVFTNFNADATLLLMNQPPPSGARYSPVDPALLGAGLPVVSISHPRGDSARWATGTSGAILRDDERPYDMYSVNFARGIIEPGSSGSGIFTEANGRLELRGILSQGALDLSCTQPDLFTLYSRMEVFYPQIAQYIGAASAAADDAPNRPQDVTTAVSPVPIDTLAAPLVLANRRIDYPGDVDLYRFTIAATSWVSASTLGSQDTVGAILDVNGVALEAVDDAQRGDTNTGITRELGPGTYYFSVAHWTPALTGAYDVSLRADRVSSNYTALWWNAAESGWGINVNHQGNILFATLFTYNTNGSPVWLVMSNGARQPDGSYSGILYRTTGPAFDAVPWTAFNAQEVGTMRLAFSTPEAGTLTYSFNGVSVTKSITRQAFKALPTCTWSVFDRSFARNFQDLWWNPAESGWGVNITHQENTLFATLFTYAANGQPMWLVMSDGVRSGATYSGTLYRTTGPAFNAVPWTPINLVVAGTMSFTFSDGNSASLAYAVDGVSVTKQIRRQVFALPMTQCEP